MGYSGFSPLLGDVPGRHKAEEIQGMQLNVSGLRGFCVFIIKGLNEVSASHLGLTTACKTRRGIVARAPILSLKQPVLLMPGGQKCRFFAALSPCYRDV